MDQLLQSLRNAGTRQSQGQFTLDMRRSASKLGMFVHQEPALPLLMLIRAGVALNISRIDIKLSRASWELSFPLDDQHEVVANLKRILANESPGQLPPDQERALGHLLWGIRFSLAADLPRCQLWARCQNVALHADFQPKTQTLDNAGETQELRVTCDLPGARWWQLKDATTRLHIRIYDSLGKRCGMCPVALYVDRVALNPRPLPFASQVEKWWLAQPNSPGRLLRPSLAETRPTKLSAGGATFHRREETPLADLEIVGPCALLQHQFAWGAHDQSPDLSLGELDVLSQLHERLVVTRQASSAAPGHSLELVQFGVPQLPRLGVRLVGEIHPASYHTQKSARPDDWLSLPEPCLLRGLSRFEKAEVALNLGNFANPYFYRTRSHHPVLLERLLARKRLADSQLTFVLDGVLCDPIPLPVKSKGLQAFAADPGLTTDLSQLKVVENAQVAPHVTFFSQHS